MFKIIPAIDLLDGKVVRLTQGDYGRVSTYPYSPAELAKQFQDHGATQIHIVDLDGAKAGRLVNQQVIASIRAAVDIPLDLGGGVRNLETAQGLFDLGINYVVLGSILVKAPQAAFEMIDQFPGRMIAGVDMKADQVAIEGWIQDSQQRGADLLARLNQYPIQSVVYTDIDRDGMMGGPNLDGLKQVAAMSQHPVIASGGVSSIQDICAVQALANLGISGCIVGKAFLDGAIGLEVLSQLS